MRLELYLTYLEPRFRPLPPGDASLKNTPQDASPKIRESSQVTEKEKLRVIENNTLTYIRLRRKASCQQGTLKPAINADHQICTGAYAQIQTRACRPTSPVPRDPALYRTSIRTRRGRGQGRD